MPKLPLAETMLPTERNNLYTLPVSGISSMSMGWGTLGEPPLTG